MTDQGENSQEKTPTHPEKTARKALQSDKISIKVFLETIGPSQEMPVTGMVKRRQEQYRTIAILELPNIKIHCGNKNCSGVRIFRPISELSVKEYGWDFNYARYICSNCREETKTYSLASLVEKESCDGILYKFGEKPSFGPTTPPRLLKLLNEHRDYFLKGRKAEIAGLGIGAFAYYRRVVESAKDEIFDAIIKVARIEGAEAEMIANLESAKKQTQFTSAVDAVKHGIPKTLFLHGENPLTLLHSALSDGVHVGTDEECIQNASMVRLVLASFAEKLADVLKEDAELVAAVKQLRQRRPRP